MKQGRANRFFLMGNLDYYAPLEKYEIVKNLEEKECVTTGAYMLSPLDI